MIASTRPALRARPGFTLVELVISITLMAIVGAAVISVLNGQQRFARAAAEIGEVRNQIYAAATVLPSDLRMLSPTDGDILQMSDSGIAMQATIATSVVCSRIGNVITLEPLNALSGRLLVPAIGDSVFIWAENGQGQANDIWRSSVGGPAYVVAAVADAPCVDPIDPGSAANAPSTALTMQAVPALLAEIGAGAPVRVTRRVRYGLYVASDGKTYLGYRDPGMAAYEAVAGPFQGYDATGTSTGMRFQYYDVNGNEITNYAQVAAVTRIEITTRARSDAPISLSGFGSPEAFADTLKIGVSLRNRF